MQNGGKKKMSTQNVAIFSVLGLLVGFIVWQNITGTTDKSIGLGGDDKA